jgi:hypothetical protein
VIARARALLVLGIAMAGSVGLLIPRSAGAEATAGAPRVFVVLVPGVTLDGLLHVPEIEALARAGGAGWMSPELDAGTLRNITILRAPSGDRLVLERVLGKIRPWRRPPRVRRWSSSRRPRDLPR